MPTASARPLTIKTIREAADRLKGVAHRTPVLTSSQLDQATGASVFLKAEVFQRAGAFKFRGAYNAVALLDEHTRSQGVVAASSGNHAQALALTSHLFGTKATVLMPLDTPVSKVEATRGYGAEIIFFDRYREDRDALQAELARVRGLSLIPPYEHYDVMAGAGTVALEFVEDVPDLDIMLVPVSGGGLIAGASTSAKALSPKIQVWGVEPEDGDDTKQSLESGRRIEVPVPKTIADGLQVHMPGELTFEINRSTVDRVVTATDEEIAAAMRFLFERLKLVVEPSGAIGVAALMQNADLFKELRVGVVLSGGNVDIARFCEIIGHSSGGGGRKS